MHFRGNLFTPSGKVFEGFIHFENGKMFIPHETKDSLSTYYNLFGHKFPSNTKYKIFRRTAFEILEMKHRKTIIKTPFKIRYQSLKKDIWDKEEKPTIVEVYLKVNIGNRIKMNIVNQRYWLLRNNRIEKLIIPIIVSLITTLIALLYSGVLTISKSIPHAPHIK